ncbi:MAG: M1 family aminopeptidase [candidate division Zixibacteria bacterium]
MKVSSNQLIAALLILILTLCSISYSRDKSGFPEIKGRFGSKTESVKIDNIVIDYSDKVRFIFEDGKLHRRKNNDPHYDFYFIGQGRIVILDSISLDNLWYMRFGRATSVEFTTAYICGKNIPGLLEVDSTQWSKDKINRRIYHKLIFQQKAADKYFGIELGCELGIWSDKEVNPPPIWIDAALDRDKQLVVRLTPDVEEQLGLYVYDELDNTPFLAAAFGMENFLISQPITVDSTIISILLRESGKFEASSRIVFPDGTDTRGIKFILPHLYKVDSVKDATGNKIEFFKKQFRSNLYIGARALPNDERDFITIFYRGKFIAARYAGYDFPASITGWFPHTPHRNLGQFIIHYTLHKDLTLNSVGDKIGESFEGDNKTVTYRSSIDISYISFASGKYDMFQDTASGVPIELYIEAHNNTGVFNRDLPGKLLSEATQSFEAFTNWFGSSQTTNLRVVDRPYFAGQSSPGLIHIPSYSIFNNRIRSHLMAHEIAHQWWGHSTIPKSYREMWLSEGMSEYAAYLYLWKIKHDPTLCDERIALWKRQIVQEGKIGGWYSRGYKAGPITMGARFLESYSPGDYIALIYAKAAYMLRMLHFEIDGPDYRTDFFVNMLGEFNRKYQGQRVTSLDFINVAAGAIGQKRAIEFFSQWLYGWRVPSFTCLYRIITDEKGRDKLYFEISVSDVSKSFSTPYPVEIEYDDGRRELFRVDRVGQKDSFELGPFPQKIKKVRFDPDDIILTRDKKVSRK